MRLLNKQEVLRFVNDKLDLLDQAEPVNPFAGSAWMLHFIKQVAGDSWTFVIPECNEVGESLMFLYRDSNRPYRVTSVNNYYASLYSPLISNRTSQTDRWSAIKNLVEQIEELRPKVAVLNLSPLNEESLDTKGIKQVLSEIGWYVKEYNCFGNWYLRCDNLSFDDYINSRESRVYNTWARKKKKFENGTLKDARLEIVVSPGGVGKAMDAYDEIYAHSWKEPEPYPDFVRNWAYICAKKGWLRLGLVWLGDKPIATQFWFTMHGRAYIFKLAYDEQYSKLSAGTVLSGHMFKHALDVDRVSEIDYLSGDDAYKRSWMTARRQRVGLVACNPKTPRGLLIGAKKYAGQIWRRIYPYR
jgi:hypothetical protein